MAPTRRTLLVVLICAPILVTIIILAIWYHRKRAENKRAQAVLAARVRIARYEARQRAIRDWQIEGERIRTLAALEGLVPERVATGRSGYNPPPPPPLRSQPREHHSEPITFQR
jgi:hypothetical protein